MLSSKSFLPAAVAAGLLLPCLWADAQNQPPVLSDVRIQLDASKEVSVAYTVRDPEEKWVGVRFQVSTDNGRTYITPAGVSGDVGEKIATGKRHLTWKSAGWSGDVVTARFRIIADDGFKPSIASLLDQVDTTRMLQRLNEVAVVRDAVSEAGRANLVKVKNVLSSGFDRAGCQVQRQPFTFGGFSGENIVGRKAGIADQDSLFVLCAAFDGMENSPAANNNGSGMAGLLEIARILAPYQFKHTVVLLSTDYTGEEMIGSNNFVFKGGLLRGERVGATIDLDRIGTYSDKANTHPVEASLEDLFPEMYKGIRADSCRANFLRLISNPGSRALANAFKRAAGDYVPGLKIYTEEFPGYGEFVKGIFSYVQFSDHICFWYRKYPAVWLTDAREGHRRDNTAEDTPANINLGFLSKVVKASLATFATLAGIEHATVFEGRIAPDRMAASR